MHETEALHIRRLTAEDLEPLHRLLSDPAVMRYLEPPFTRAQTEAFLQKAGMGREPLIWAVEDGRGFAGYVIYHPYDETSMELGWVLASDRWGGGGAFDGQGIIHGIQAGVDGVVGVDDGIVGVLQHIGQTGGLGLYDLHAVGILHDVVLGGREKRIDKGYPTF